MVHVECHIVLLLQVMERGFETPNRQERDYRRAYSVLNVHMFQKVASLWVGIKQKHITLSVYFCTVFWTIFSE